MHNWSCEHARGGTMDQQQVSKSDSLSYIEEMLVELLKLARNTDQRLLIYLLDMALSEAREGLQSQTWDADTSYRQE